MTFGVNAASKGIVRVHFELRPPVYCRFKSQALDLIQKRNVCFGVMMAKMGFTVGEFLSFESVLGKGGGI